jgi:hypothetical protein
MERNNGFLLKLLVIMLICASKSVSCLLVKSSIVLTALYI